MAITICIIEKYAYLIVEFRIVTVIHDDGKCVMFGRDFISHMTELETPSHLDVNKHKFTKTFELQIVIHRFL